MAFLTPSPKTRFFTEAGAPLVGGKLHTYAAGTTTPLATYTSQGGTTPNTNPVILDANGEADVWLTGASSYKFTLTDSDDAVQWTVDNIVTQGTMSLQSASAVAITGGTLNGVTISSSIISGSLISSLSSPLAVVDGGTGGGTASDARTALGLGTMAVVNSPVPIANGGTASTTASDARTALGLGTMATVASPVPVGNGGTGTTTLTANNVILGNGTSAVAFVAPGSSGNVLTSNGTTWASTTPTAGLNSSAGAVGSLCFAYNWSASDIQYGSTIAGADLEPSATSNAVGTYGRLTGTWRCLGFGDTGQSTLWVRTA